MLRGVELPVAMPLIVSGIRLAVVQVWATATIGPGRRPRPRSDHHPATTRPPAEMIAGSLIVAVVALVLEGVMAFLQRTWTRCPPEPLAGRCTSCRVLV